MPLCWPARGDSAPGPVWCVITSYSIHYTKLYDETIDGEELKALVFGENAPRGSAEVAEKAEVSPGASEPCIAESETDSYNFV